MDGEGVTPGEWVLSRVCEEFGCTPSVALEEDATTVLAIMDLRAYARARELVLQPDTDNDALLKLGLSQDAIDGVMDNVDREMRRDKRSSPA